MVTQKVLDCSAIYMAVTVLHKVGCLQVRHAFFVPRFTTASIL